MPYDLDDLKKMRHVWLASRPRDPLPNASPTAACIGTAAVGNYAINVNQKWVGAVRLHRDAGTNPGKRERRRITGSGDGGSTLIGL